MSCSRFITMVLHFLKNNKNICLSHFIVLLLLKPCSVKDGGLVSRSVKKLSNDMVGTSGQNPLKEKASPVLCKFLFKQGSPTRLFRAQPVGSIYQAVQSHA